VISQLDTGFKDLGVWVDSNSDGVSAVDEVKSLSLLHIAKIDLQATVGGAIHNGNIVGLTSSYQTTDGATHAAADVWFQTDKIDVDLQKTATRVESVDKAIAALGGISTPDLIATEQTTFIESKLAVESPLTDMRSRVSSIASAMGSFNNSVAGNDQPGSLTDQKSEGAISSSATMLVASSMTDAMAKFDFGGGGVPKLNAVVTPSANTLNLKGIQDATGDGFLAGSVK